MSAEEITPQDAEAFIEMSWKHAHDVSVESIRVDSEGVSNAWTSWIALAPSDGGELVEIPLSMNIKIRRDADGTLELL